MRKKFTIYDAAEMLWTVVANVSGSDWKKQSPIWQKAAARWRDAYFNVLRKDKEWRREYMVRYRRFCIKHNMFYRHCKEWDEEGCKFEKAKK